MVPRPAERRLDTQQDPLQQEPVQQGQPVGQQLVQPHPIPRPVRPLVQRRLDRPPDPSRPAEAQRGQLLISTARLATKAHLKYIMVPAVGIEPTTFSLEGYCSSTELRGHRNERIIRVFACKQEKTPLPGRF